MNKKLFWVVLFLLLRAATFVEAQQATKMARIGVLPSGSPSSMATHVNAFRQGLREVGYVEGQNIVLEYRYGEGKPERFRDLADELVRLKPDIIVVSSTGFTAAAKQATDTTNRCRRGWESCWNPELLPAWLDRVETSQGQPAWLPIKTGCPQCACNLS